VNTTTPRMDPTQWFALAFLKNDQWPQSWNMMNNRATNIDKITPIPG
jgi:hypothetical protein